MKMTKLKLFKVSVVLLVLYGSTLYAQSGFKYRAALPVPDSTGWYKINLRPLLVAKSQQVLGDVRVVNAAGKTVAYIPYLDSSLLRKSYLDTRYFVLPHIITNDTSQGYVMSNPTNVPLAAIWLKLKNMAVSRNVSLQGSDNLKNWFAIKENVPLEQASSSAAGTYEQVLRFPAVSYRYFKIAFSGKHQLPIDILQASVHQAQVPYWNDNVLLPKPAFIQKENRKVSIVRMTFSDAYTINRLYLNIVTPRFYQRSVSIYQDKGSNRILVSSNTIKSGQSNLHLTAKAKQLELEITNNDNAPLQITGIDAYHLNYGLVSHLEKGQHYYLLTGNQHATAPDFDLKFFADSIKYPLPEITHLAVSRNLNNPQNSTVSNNYKTVLIWLSIAVALIILILLTRKMMAEVKARQSADNS
jgi:hypothetical protein